LKWFFHFFFKTWFQDIWVYFYKDSFCHIQPQSCPLYLCYYFSCCKLNFIWVFYYFNTWANLTLCLFCQFFFKWHIIRSKVLETLATICQTFTKFDYHSLNVQKALFFALAQRHTWIGKQGHTLLCNCTLWLVIYGR
jgi:hypothetical protein